MSTNESELVRQRIVIKVIKMHTFYNNQLTGVFILESGEWCLREKRDDQLTERDSVRYTYTTVHVNFLFINSSSTKIKKFKI